MKMLSVLQRTVENEGRTAIRAVEWFLWIRDEREKQSLGPHPLQKTNAAKGRPPRTELQN